MPLNVTIHVEGKISHQQRLNTYVTALQDTLSKLQLTSSYYKACDNKKKWELFVNKSTSQ